MYKMFLWIEKECWNRALSSVFAIKELVRNEK